MAESDKPAESAATMSFVYGFDLRPAHEVDAVTDAQVLLTDGSKSHITMHLIEGTKEQIKAMLMQSVDAFFELHDEI